MERGKAARCKIKFKLLKPADEESSLAYTPTIKKRERGKGGHALRAPSPFFSPAGMSLGRGAEVRPLGKVSLSIASAAGPQARLRAQAITNSSHYD